MEPPTQPTDWETCPPKSALVNTSHTKLHLTVRGAARLPGQPVVICESGSGISGTCWIAVARHLQSNLRTFYYDRAGIGRSPPSDVPRTAENMAKELYDLLQVAEIRPPYVLVAHTYGGIIVREFLDLCGKGDVVGIVFVDANHEQTLRKVDIPFDAMDAIMAGVDFLEVTGFNEEHNLLPEEYDAIFNPPSEAKHSSGAEGEKEHLITSSDTLMAKQQIERGMLTPYPVTVICGDALRDQRRVFEAACAKDIGTAEQRAGVEAFLGRVEKYFEPLQHELLKISPGNGRFVHAKKGHLAPMVEPGLVAEEVLRVTKKYAVGVE
jgi:pimeloyl-ACP methyl ester carboxylesterase